MSACTAPSMPQHHWAGKYWQGNLGDSRRRGDLAVRGYLRNLKELGEKFKGIGNFWVIREIWGKEDHDFRCIA